MSNPNKLQSTMALAAYDFDPDATTETEIAWVDMRDFNSFLTQFVRTIGTSAVTFKIMGNPASDGSGTDVDIVTHTVSDEPDAVGDTIILETDRQQIAQKAAAAGVEGVRYVTAVVSVATATDEAVVNYLRDGIRCHDAMTADNVA